jgi:hypothetical protein
MCERMACGRGSAVKGGRVGTGANLVKNRHLVFDGRDHELLMHLNVGGCTCILPHGVNERVVLAELPGDLVD